MYTGNRGGYAGIMTGAPLMRRFHEFVTPCFELSFFCYRFYVDVFFCIVFFFSEIVFMGIALQSAPKKNGEVNL